MRLNVQVQADRAQRLVTSVPKQARFAAAWALNGAAFKAREDWRQEMARVFDRPKPYILNSIYVTRRATPASLIAEVLPRYAGGKGVDPAKVLQAEVMGGPRRPKRFEIALQRKGLLPSGFGAVPAKWLVTDPSIGDGHGGVRGSFIVRLLSYFEAFGEVGYRANANDKSRRRRAKRGKSERGFSTIRGVEYFISRGRGEFSGRGAWRNGQQQRLPAGIWQRSGIHGVDIKPVFLFVPLPRYRVRLDLTALRRRAREEHFPPLFAQAFRRAMETAR